jgi:hypothetical protein
MGAELRRQTVVEPNRQWLFSAELKVQLPECWNQNTLASSEDSEG